MRKNEELKTYIKELGISKCGFANLRDCIPENIPEKLKHLESGISIAVRLSDEVISHIEKEPTHTYFHHYRTINSFIDQAALKITMKLQAWGYLAFPIPASQSINDTKERSYKGILSHKMVATLSGLGWIGKSDLLITEEFGPRIRLGSILTNMKLEYDAPTTHSKCKSCNICVSSCPAFAIKGENWVIGRTREELYDAKACSKHMSNHYDHIGRGSVCGICIKVCPKGNQILKR